MPGSHKTFVAMSKHNETLEYDRACVILKEIEITEIMFKEFVSFFDQQSIFDSILFLWTCCIGYPLLPNIQTTAKQTLSVPAPAVNGSSFSVWLIPHTLEVTTLGNLQPEGLVNLEFDLLAKYVESILLARSE